MFFCISTSNPAKLGLSIVEEPSVVASIRRERAGLTAETMGLILYGPAELPKELHLLFENKLHQQLNGQPYEWSLRLKFIAEGLLLQGWKQAESQSHLEHTCSGLHPDVQKWIANFELQRAARPVLILFEQLREVGFSAYHGQFHTLEVVSR